LILFFEIRLRIDERLRRIVHEFKFKSAVHGLLAFSNQPSASHPESETER
jgi:hypothetical protein